MGLDNPSPLELSRWLPRDLLSYCRSIDNENHVPATDTIRSCGGHDLYDHAYRPVHSSPGRSLGGLVKASASVRRNLFANKPPHTAVLGRPNSDLFAHGGGTFMFPDFSLPAVSEAEFEDAFSHALLGSESTATHINPHSLL